MINPTQVESTGGNSQASLDRLTRIRETVERVSDILPSQGPITVFVAQNILRPFEKYRFHEGLCRASESLPCEVYLTEDRYRRLCSEGRITAEDLAEVLKDRLGASGSVLIGKLGTRYELQLAMLSHLLVVSQDRHLEWLQSETDVLRKFRQDTLPETKMRLIKGTQQWIERLLQDDQQTLASLAPNTSTAGISGWPEAKQTKFTLQVLWKICVLGTEAIAGKLRMRRSLRVRDTLLETTRLDSDAPVNELMIRFCSVYLDQGLGHFELPNRERGFWQSFCALYRFDIAPVDGWRRRLSAMIRDYEARGLGATEVIEESLNDLGIGEELWDEYLTETLLVQPGWAGMTWQMETNAEWTARPAPAGSLVEYTAVRLLLERLSIADIARHSFGYQGPLSELKSLIAPRLKTRYVNTAEQRAYLIFQLAQVRGWSPELLHSLSEAEWEELVNEVEAFPSIERRGVFQSAYERNFRMRALRAISARLRRPAIRPQKPRFQLIMCIDDREESFRRYLEEKCPDCETFGAAGFFTTPIYYRGASDANFVPLCPIVMKPRHYVCEEVAYGLAQTHRRRAHARQLLGKFSHLAHRSSRSFFFGVLMSLMGSLASIPLVARVLFPRLTARWVDAVGTLVQTPPVTRLRLERFEGDPAPTGNHLGFTLDEMADIVLRQLQDMGLTKDFSRLIIFAGHGSSSVNNPHESAYHCGACGGARGGPNARSISQMGNDPRVRAKIAAKGQVLPDDTIFIGCYHNTCDDSITWYDLEEVPASHRDEFEQIRIEIDQVCALNSLERIRRFAMAPRRCTATQAWDHVEERSVDLSQTRPEYTHASVGMCLVGRRDRIRGLYLDRRSFLVSYDPRQDDDKSRILLRVLEAAIPVCAGISLNYFFSTVDNSKLGCGSKLPHNITSLLGVMDGAASDLRTGLSSQMVEIHEPMRILFVIETTPETMNDLISRNATITRLVRNEWVQLVTMDPETGALHLLHRGEFIPTTLPGELRQAGSSQECYFGSGNMEFSLIVPASPATQNEGGVK